MVAIGGNIEKNQLGRTVSLQKHIVAILWFRKASTQLHQQPSWLRRAQPSWQVCFEKSQCRFIQHKLHGLCCAIFLAKLKLLQPDACFFHLFNVWAPKEIVTHKTHNIMFALIPYLIFDGKAEEAFMHYRTIFGGEFAMLSRFSDSPDGEQLPEEEKNRIMHITYPLKNGFRSWPAIACHQKAIAFRMA
jgi:hypothetical protein